MFVIARTVAHLFRQLHEQGRPLRDLELVRGTYDVATPLHSGRFEVDGTPFLVHSLGVASVVAQAGASASVIGAGVLHNVYTTGDWGDGRRSGAFADRRRRLREAVGHDIEFLLFDLREARAAGHLERLVVQPDAELDDRARSLALLEVADLLDKWEDGRVLYSEPGRSDRSLVAGREEAIAALAGRVGGPALADAFDAAFRRAASEPIHDALRLGRRYSVVVPPPSWRGRRSLSLLRQARRLPRVWKRRPSPSPRAS